MVLRWTRLTFYGWCLGFALILVFIALSGMIGLGDSQFPVGLGMGLGVGLVQRRMIAERGAAVGASWWRASAVGLAAPFIARDVAHLLDVQLPYALPGSIVIGGLVVGLWQSRLLRLSPPLSTTWAAASVLGWALGGATVVLNDKVLPKTPGIIGALIYIAVVLAGGILLGAATGLVLPRIIQRPETS